MPLRYITTEEVAEALLGIFSRVGVPDEVLSDRGAQFTSGLVNEVNRLLSIKQLNTTPHHPLCNGLCEKMNGTIKTMIKRLSPKGSAIGTGIWHLHCLRIAKCRRKVLGSRRLNCYTAGPYVNQCTF